MEALESRAKESSPLSWRVGRDHSAFPGPYLCCQGMEERPRGSAEFLLCHRAMQLLAKHLLGTSDEA